MGKSNCAVVSCTNSTYKLNKWKKGICSVHQVCHQDCICPRPFKLFFFPSELKNSESRERWINAMKRVKDNNKKWIPTESDRVCSEHFVDGEPTQNNPDPTIKLGYEVSMKKTRRNLTRKPLPVKRKLCVSSEESETLELDLPQKNTNNRRGLWQQFYSRSYSQQSTFIFFANTIRSKFFLRPFISGNTSNKTLSEM